MTPREEALLAAEAEADPASLKAAERLRLRFGPELAAWAATQASLRRRAAGRFTRSAQMWFTPSGLEQATREPVANWRAQRFASLGCSKVWDLGCGIGSDAMAFAEAGLEVVALDADPATAEVAAHNLALVGGQARHGLAEEADPPGDAALFLDPARRTARGRSWRVEDFTPPWDFVLEQLSGPRFAAVKLGPGLPKQLIPAGVQACWVSERGDVVEVSLWNRLPAGPRAVLLDGKQVHELGPQGARPLPVSGVGRYVYEPDGAVIRAGLIEAVAPEHQLWLLDPQVAYLSANEAIESPYLTGFEVQTILPYDLKALRSWAREHAVGTLEIKKRAIEVDPAALRRQLKLRGPNSATLILARTIEGTRALVVNRCQA